MSEIQQDHKCNIVAVGKRRDGGTRYWCLSHKADATAKYGKPALYCRYAKIPSITSDDELVLNVADFPGGLALWGAVPPIYDTTESPLDKGVHIHARRKGGGEKKIDQTYRRVIINEGRESWEINELDAIYYMVSRVFGFTLKFIKCTHCEYPHLDKDWFSVHPHQSHLCAGCGKYFRDTDCAIGNPVFQIGRLPSAKQQKFQQAAKSISIRQSDYAGGIQLWGSNPAILWTSDEPQFNGIHVHAFDESSDVPVIDETFKSVEIDGIELDAAQVRIYMAQLSLPHLQGRIVSIKCDNCGAEQFDTGASAYSPVEHRDCFHCGKRIKHRGSRLRKLIANPIVGQLDKVSSFSNRVPKDNDFGLLVETI